MLLEFSTAWTIAKFLIKLTQKFGKDWLRSKFHFDQEVADLAYEGVDNPSKLLDLIILLNKDKTKLKSIHENAIKVQDEKEVKMEKLILPNLVLDYYLDLLEDIFYVAKIRKGEIIILEGFLNGENYISYYSTGDEKDIKKEEDYLSVPTFSKIILVKVENAEERAKTINAQRDLIKFSKTKIDKYNAIKFADSSLKVIRIYESSIEVEPYSISFSLLNPQNKLEPSENYIKDTKGFELMKSSLKQYIDDIVKNLEKWNDVVKAI